jgi:site-specific recombinase XerD
MTAIFKYLEINLANALLGDDKRVLYYAYLWRAVIRMLYTSGLRNFELRGLTDEDVNIEQLCGTVLGK